MVSSTSWNGPFAFFYSVLCFYKQGVLLAGCAKYSLKDDRVNFDQMLQLTSYHFNLF